MNIFLKINHFFAGLFENQNRKAPVLSENQWNQKQTAGLHRVRNNLTELVFQRKKLESQITKLTEEQRLVVQDLEQAAMQDKDDVANYLMSRKDELQKECRLLEEHLQKVIVEISRTKKIEGQLVEQVETSKIQFAILKSRRDSVAMRKSLATELSSASLGSQAVPVGLHPLEEEILRMDAALETLDSGESKIQKDVQDLRSQRSRSRQSSRLIALKQQLRARQLPAAPSESTKLFSSESLVAH